MRLSLSALCLAGGSLVVSHDLAPIFGENIFARLWRTALTGPPSLGDTHGWPHFTQGAYNNTPQEDVVPGTYVKHTAGGPAWRIAGRLRASLQSESGWLWQKHGQSLSLPISI